MLLCTWSNSCQLAGKSVFCLETDRADIMTWYDVDLHSLLGPHLNLEVQSHALGRGW